MQFMRRKTLALAIAALPFTAHANPQGGQIVAGSAEIRQETPTKVGITQTSDKAIIDWKSFSIGKNEQTQFYQPSASSVTLNRVVGEDPSQILGRLTANGRVFLVNPNGIFFGKDAQIDVAGLVASTHNIRNEDFLAGRYDFNIPGKPGAAVINEGTIRIADTGIAAFVAPSVANRGIIAARLGKVVLAAANGFTLDFYGDNLVSFFVADEVAQTAFDIEGKQLTSFVENSGRIEAQGGYVLLTAKAAEGVVQSVINQSGSIEATTVGTHKGEIILNAGKGSLAVAGSLDASAPDGGDGGFIETSGAHVTIAPDAHITTAAPFGKTGKWLIDPTDYTIAASGGDITGAALAAYLGMSDVEVQTLATGNSGNGDIRVNDAVSWSSLNKLTLTAHHNVNVNAAITASGGGSIKLRADNRGTGTGTVAFGAGGHVTVNSSAAIGIYYNPISYTHAATKSNTNGNPYSGNVTLIGGSTLTACMLVNDVSQLQAINTNLSGNYALGKDIDASSTSAWNSGAGFEPIGALATASRFRGRFDGLNHMIDSLHINRPTTDYVGLFGYADGSTLNNIGMQNVNIIGRDNVGGLVGLQTNGAYLGYSWSTGTVSGRSAGGLAGVSYYYDPLTSIWGRGSTIENSYSGANVTATDGAGGLVRYIDLSVVRNSFSTGSVSGSTEVGSLVGASLNSDITNSYASGQVTGTGTRIGGLVGYAWQGATSSYFDTQATGQTSSAGGTGKTTAQMKQQASYAGWDFTNVWRINEGTSYPYLAWTASTTVDARQLLQPSDSASSVGSSVGATKKVVTDICSVAPVVCRPELAPIPPRVEIPKTNSGSVPDSPKRGGALNAALAAVTANCQQSGTCVSQLPIEESVIADKSRSDPVIDTDVLIGSDPIGAEIRQLLNDYSDRTDGSAVSRMTQTEFFDITDRLRSAGVSLVDKEIDQYLDRNLSAVDSLWGHRLDEAKENMYREAEASWSDRGKVAFAAAIAPAMTVADLTGIGIAAKYLKVAFKATKGKDMLNTFGKIYDNLANNRRGWNNSNVLSSFEKLKKVADSNTGKRLLEIMKLELELADGNAPDENDVLKAELRRTLETLGLPSAGSATDAIRELIVQATAGAMEVVQADSKDVSLEAKRVALEALSSAAELIPVAGNWVALHNTYGEVEREFKDSQQTYVELNARYINARQQVYRDALSMKLQYLAGQVRP